MKALVFDIGGTNLRYAITGGKFVPVLVPVPKEYAAAVSTLATLAKHHRVSTIVGGLPGPLDPKKTQLLQSTHLPQWAKKPFQRDVARASGARVVLENDNALVGLGEATYGPGRGQDIVAYIGIGTGIGGVRIVHGQVDANAHGFEPGHHILDLNIRSHRHPSPHPGDWESLISGSGIYIQTGRRSETITDRKFWSRMEERVALGLINTAMFWSPSMVILGGSLMKKLSVSGIDRHFRRHMKIFPTPIPIRRAKFGDFGGLHGAIALAKRSTYMLSKHE